MNRKILVVDDNELFRESIVETLRRQGYEITSAINGSCALEVFQSGLYDLVISDMKMPGMSGIELLEKVKQADPDVPFLIITAYGAIDTAVDAMKKGAYDFLQKSDNLIRELELTVQRTLEYRCLLKENVRLKNELKAKWQYLGNASDIDQMREMAKTIAESRSTVLLTGESGTGKELVARSIHYQSPRSHGPFVKINCAALPEGLIESELFGHEKGAFTGALCRKAGKFESASGGTLLLDEIGEMPLTAQAKLLRVLQEREIQKVGGDVPVEVDVRIVATTNRCLEEMVSDGSFREDLFYRINVFHIHIPPLRNRKEDIEQLAMHFICKYNDENGFSVEGLEDGCIENLKSHNWPGNVRELENAVERAVVLTRTGKIRAALFDSKSHSSFGSKTQTVIDAGITIAEAERILIFKTLEECNQNRTRAAEMLGISIRTLRNKLNEYGLERAKIQDAIQEESRG